MTYAMPEYNEDEWKNCNGKPVREEDVEFRKQDYIAGIGRNGKPIPKWELLQEQDKYGFYSKGNIDEKKGKSKIKVRLPKGTKFLRYGTPHGHYTAPLGSEYERLSLPYVKESIPYNEYEVVAEWIEVEWGYTALGFDSIDRCIQYYNEDTVNVLKEKGMIKKIKRGTIV